MQYTTEREQINRTGRTEIVITHVSFHRNQYNNQEFVQVEHEIKGQGVRYGMSHDYSAQRIAELKRI